MKLVLNKFGLSIDDKFRTLVALTLVPVMILTCGFSCNVQNVVDRVNSILEEVGPALQIITSLLPLLGAKQIPDSVVTGINAWVPKVQKDVSELDDLYKQYSADLANNADAQSKINAIIATTDNDLTSIFDVIRVLDPSTQAKISNLVTAVIAAVASAENIIKAAEGKVSAKKAASTVFVTDGKDFKAKYNAVLKAPSGDAVVDAATAKVGL